MDDWEKDRRRSSLMSNGTSFLIHSIISNYRMGHIHTWETEERNSPVSSVTKSKMLGMSLSSLAACLSLSFLLASASAILAWMTSSRFSAPTLEWGSKPNLGHRKPVSENPVFKQSRSSLSLGNAQGSRIHWDSTGSEEEWLCFGKLKTTKKVFTMPSSSAPNSGWHCEWQSRQDDLWHYTLIGYKFSFQRPFMVCEIKFWEARFLIPFVPFIGEEKPLLF